jgi:hypothetical protein
MTASLSLLDNQGRRKPMMKRHGILVLIAVAFLMSAGGLATPTVPTAPAASVLTLAPAPNDLGAQVCSASSDILPGDGHADRVPPGCCTTQCNVDKDCNRICGKGVCACIQENSCCRRCVY